MTNHEAKCIRDIQELGETWRSLWCQIDVTQIPKHVPICEMAAHPDPLNRLYQTLSRLDLLIVDLAWRAFEVNNETLPYQEQKEIRQYWDRDHSGELRFKSADEVMEGSEKS